MSDDTRITVRIPGDLLSLATRISQARLPHASRQAVLETAIRLGLEQLKAEQAKGVHID